ncbi:hypothetical protein DW103_06785 [Parabacteroides sp. AM08-6]|nr:hypothetical protein DW103_06785 [Parabacteroides sp. AM08-6]
MLVASIVMLLSVIIPHHHHSNGLPCYKSLATEVPDGGHNHPQSHDCGCSGHNVALYTSILSHATDSDISQHLFPLLVLFDYINPPEPVFCQQLFENEQDIYIESMHDTWISTASGLRAPPFALLFV